MNIISIKFKLLFLFVLIGAISLFFTGTACSEDDILISTGNHNYPPSSWTEGDQIVGVAAELLKLISADLDIKISSPYKGPWKRVQHYAKRGEVDILTTLYKNPEREKFLDYVPESYMDDQNVIWVKKGREFPFEKWDDLIGKVGGVNLGDTFGEEFDNFMQKLKIYKVTNIDQNFKKLAAERLDYIPVGLSPGMITCRRLGLENDIVYLPKPLLSNQLYIAFSKKSKYKKYIFEFEKAIRKYKEDGTIAGLIEKNMERYMKKQ